MILPILLLFQAVPLPVPQRPVPDPGIIATSQKITPAGVQSVFTGKVTGVRFGDRPGEVWVAAGNTVYRMGWADNTVHGRVALGGRAGVYGLTVDVTGKRLLVSTVGRVPAGARRPAGVAANANGIAQLSSISGDSLHPFGGFGHDMAGSPAVARQPNSTGHRVVVLPPRGPTPPAADSAAMKCCEGGFRLVRNDSPAFVKFGAVLPVNPATGEVGKR